MEGPAWRVEIANPAQRDLKRLSHETRRRVLAALKGLSVIPREGDIKKLQGSGDEYRLRIGDWRAVFEVDHEQKVVRVLAVAHRSDVYRG